MAGLPELRVAIDLTTTLEASTLTSPSVTP